MMIPYGYKQTEVGVIPEDWDVRKIGDFTDITAGGTPSTSHPEYWNGEILWMSSGELNNRRIHNVIGRITELGYNNSSTHMIPKNCVLIGLAGQGKTRGTVAVNYVELCTNQSIAAIFPSKEHNSEYLYQNLRSRYAELRELSSGDGGRGGLNLTIIKNFPCAFPKLQEQNRIAEALSDVDGMISSLEKLIAKYKSIKTACLQQMFPQNGETVPRMRLPGFTGAWEQRKLSELASIHARIGWQNLRTSEFLDSGDYMLITGTDFNDGAINFSTCHYVERERYEQDRNIQIHNGSILITKDGTLGKVAYVQGLSMPATLNAGVFNVQIKDANIVDEKYLFQYLKAPYLMDYVSKKATGGTIKHLNQNILVDFPVVMSKKSEQILIGAYFQQLDSLITFHQRKLEKVQKIKQGMMQQLLTGKIRLK